MLDPNQLYGTLCVLDPEPHRFSAQDLDLLVILSTWLRLYIHRDLLQDRTVFDA